MRIIKKTSRAGFEAEQSEVIPPWETVGTPKGLD